MSTHMQAHTHSVTHRHTQRDTHTPQETHTHARTNKHTETHRHINPNNQRENRDRDGKGVMFFSRQTAEDASDRLLAQLNIKHWPEHTARGNAPEIRPELI